MPPDLDQANRTAWASAQVVDIFVRREGFSSEGEACLMRRIATEARDQPILDLGVGGGRTVPFLRSVSAHYVGLDYLEELVRATRSRYPDACIEHMDARDLSAFADGTFGLVVFSSNGIDGVPHADRRTIFSEIHRVLRPGALFAYSTHNLDYRLAGRAPWRSDWRRVVEHPTRAVRFAIRLPRMIRERRRLRALTARGDGWASIASLAYGFAVVWHYVTLAEALRELRESGFASTVEVYSPSGFSGSIDAGSTTEARLVCGLDTSRWPSIHLVARKP